MKWSIFSCLAVIATLLFSGPASSQATYHAFIWSANTGMQDLGSLGGSSFAQGINASGQVVGYYLSVLGQLRPFLGLKAEACKTSALSGATQVSRLASMILGRLPDGRLRQQARRMRFSGVRAAG